MDALVTTRTIKADRNASWKVTRDGVMLRPLPLT